MKFELFYCKVEKTQDPNELGRIQVRALPEMMNFAEEDLPWTRSFLTHASTSNSFSLNVPALGTYVWCIFLDDFMKDGWYLNGVFLDGKFDKSKLDTDFGKIEGLADQKLNEVKFTRYEDGTVTFQNPVTKEYGTLHSSGSYMFIKADGSITSYSKKDIELKNDNGGLKITSTGDVEVTASGLIKLAGESAHLVRYDELKAIIEGINRNLDARIMIDPLSGVTGTVNPGMASAVFDPMGAVNLTQMKATKVKTG